MRKKNWFEGLRGLKKKGGCCLLSLLLLVLAGCTALPSGNREPEETERSRLRAESGEATGQTVPDSAGASDRRGGRTTEPESVQKPEDAASKEVESNGGYFVKVGDDVYFPVHDENTIGNKALWGDFIQFYSDDAARLMRYTKEGEVESLKAGPGGGELFYANGKFYFTAYEGTASGENGIIFSTDMEGKEKKEIGIGAVAASDEEGNYLLLSDRYQMDLLRLFDTKSETVHPVETAGNAVVPIGIKGEYFFYLEFEYESETFEHEERIFAGLLKNPEKRIYLGNVPEMENMEIASLEFGDVYIKDSDVYFVAGLFVGSGHMLDSYSVLKASLDEEGSLALMDGFAALYEEEDNGIMPKIAFEGSRPILLAQGAYGNLDLMEESIYLYDETGRKVVVPAAIELFDDWSPLKEVIEFAEYIDGKVYMVRHRGLYDLEASFGWRDGYDRLYTEYLVYDPGSKNMEVLHSVGNDGYSVEAQVWMGEGDYLFFRPFFYEGNDMYEGYQIYRVDVSREVDYVPLVSVADPKEPWDIPDVAPETVILSFNEEGELVNIQRP